MDAMCDISNAKDIVEELLQVEQLLDINCLVFLLTFTDLAIYNKF